MADGKAELSGSASAATTKAGGSRLRDGFAALLPAAIALAGGFGYDELRHRGIVAPYSQASAARTPAALPSLVDTRSLALPSPAAPVESANANPRVRLAHVAQQRITADLVSRLQVGLEAASASTAGSYVVVRGLPDDWAITHGVKAGPSLWLIEAIDLGRLSVRPPAGDTRTAALILDLIGADGRFVVRDTISIDVAPRMAPAETTSAPAVAVAVALPQKSAEPPAGNDARVAVASPVDIALPDPVMRLPATAPVIEVPAVVALAPTLLRATEAKVNNEGGAAAAPAAAGSVATAVPAAPVRSKATEAPSVAGKQAPAKTAAVAIAAAAVQPVTEQPAQTKAKAIGDLVEQKRLAGNLDRGRRLLDVGNVAMARPLLERAAAAGSAQAALLLGASYDPLWLRTKGAIGVEPDETKARSWYEIARKGGAADAEKMLSALAR